MGKLTQTAVDRQKKAGRYGDGGCLYLLVKESGTKSWVLRFHDRLKGRYQDHGLGSCEVLSLKEARILAVKLRAGLLQGRNPIDEKQKAIAAAMEGRSRDVTFWYCAEQCIAKKAMFWRNEKHAKQWVSTLSDYCRDWKDQPIASITADMVEAALRPKWYSHTETASRVQQRIASIFDWAISRALYPGANPARWKGHLETRLDPPSQIKVVQHRVALPYKDINQLVGELVGQGSLSARALLLQLLTATRPAEAAGARWEEFSLSEKKWTIPASRRKTKKELVVPLSSPVLSLIKNVPVHDSGYLFPGMSGKKAITTDAGLKTLQLLRPGITAHGFRSSFSDWAAENTIEPIVTEAALGHAIKSEVIAAYRRTSLFEKRAELMRKWAKYCFT